MVSKASIQRLHTRAMVEVQREVARQCSGLKQVIRQASRGTSQISRQIAPCRDLSAAKIFPPGKPIRKHNHRSLRITVVASRMPASKRTRRAIQVLTSPMSAFAKLPSSYRDPYSRAHDVYPIAWDPYPDSREPSSESRKSNTGSQDQRHGNR